MSSVTVAHSKMRMKNSLVFLMLLASMKKMFSNFWLTIRKTKENSHNFTFCSLWVTNQAHHLIYSGVLSPLLKAGENVIFTHATMK